MSGASNICWGGGSMGVVWVVGGGGWVGDDFLELRPSNQSMLEGCEDNSIHLYESLNWRQARRKGRRRKGVLELRELEVLAFPKSR